MTRPRLILTLSSAILALALAVPAAAQQRYQHLRIIAPAAPGGGWDQTARVMQQVLQAAGIVHTSSVENIPGAGGTIGLARFATAERGNGDVVMVSGQIMLSAIVTYQSVLTLRDVTPIARLIGEYEVVIVPAASPFQSLQDLIAAFKAHPQSISWAGGSAGGTDQVLAWLIAEAAGVDPKRVNYIAFSGGGEAMPAILGGQVSVGINGLAGSAPQIEAGTVRVLGISSAERVPSLDAPTLREQGADVVIENWRSLVAPPGVSPADRQHLEEAVEAMVRSRPWQEALARYQWSDRFLTGAAFARFTEDEEARMRAIVRKLGTGRSNAAAVSLGPYPALVLGGLLATALTFTVATVRSRGRGTTGAVARWRSIALVASGIALDLLLVERLGFVLASTAMFWLTARAFDPRHPIRDAAFAAVLSVSAYLVFARLLQLPLPPGVLARGL